MANTKPKTGSNTSKYVLLAILLIVVTIPTVYLGFQLYLNKVDSDKFAILKADFLKLQTEFNKINTGWEYGESCVGKGGVYTDNEPSSCSMGLGATMDGATLEAVSEHYVSEIAKSSFFTQVGETKGFKLDGKEHLETALMHEKTGEKNCELLAIKNSSQGDKYVVSIGCRSSARAFYYDRVDR